MAIVFCNTILALGNKWCKDNRQNATAQKGSILALGNKWCKDNGS